MRTFAREFYHAMCEDGPGRLDNRKITPTKNPSALAAGI